MYALILIKYFHLFHDINKKNISKKSVEKVCFGQYLIYLFYLLLCVRLFHSVLLICQIKINDTIFWVKTVLCRKMFE